MKERVSTSAAPKALGPYSQAIMVTNPSRMLFASGQIALDPTTGEMVTGDVKAQARRVLDNLLAVIRAAGLDAGDVVRTTIYLKDMADFPAVNEVYAGYFPVNPPARATVGVAALPRNALVEIDAVCAAV